jgi:hypothetical protein
MKWQKIDFETFMLAQLMLFLFFKKTKGKTFDNCNLKIRRSQASEPTNPTSNKSPTKNGAEPPMTLRRKKEFGSLGHSLTAQRPEATDRSVEMAATTSRTSVDISREIARQEAEGGQAAVHKEEEEELRSATTESAPVTMSVEAPPQDQLGRQKGLFGMLSGMVISFYGVGDENSIYYN